MVNSAEESPQAHLPGRPSQTFNLGGLDSGANEMAAVLEQLEALQKAQQVLYSLGKTIHRECKTIANEVKTALRTLQNNAKTNAQRKKGRFTRSILQERSKDDGP